MATNDSASPKLDRELRKPEVWKQARSYVDQYLKNVDECEDEDATEFWEQRLEEVARDFFYDEVIAHLRHPACVTPEDLTEQFVVNLLSPLEERLRYVRSKFKGDLPETREFITPDTLSEYFENRYGRFCNAVVKLCETETPPLSIKVDLDEEGLATLPTCDFNHDASLWSSDEFRLAILSTHPYSAVFELKGRFSPRAIQAAKNEFTDILKSALTSFVLVEESPARAELSRIINDMFGETPVMATDDDGTVKSSPVDFRCNLKDLIEAYIRGQPKPKPKTGKPRLSKRIRLAQQLLVEADRQPSFDVALALCVGGIDALICEDSGQAAKTFAWNVTAILEPNPEFRERAVKYLTTLYKKRSNVLHGSDMTCSAADYRNARRLAAAVLLAIIRSRRLINPDDCESDTFIKVLHRHILTGTKFDAVALNHPDVRDLWRHKTDEDDA